MREKSGSCQPFHSSAKEKSQRHLQNEEVSGLPITLLNGKPETEAGASIKKHNEFIEVLFLSGLKII